MRLLLIACLACAASPALADPGAECLKAVDAGNVTLAKQYADMILFSAGKLSAERAADAAACLLAVTGQNYVYAADIRKFEAADEHDQAVVERQRQTAEKNRVVRENEAKKRAADEKDKAAAAKAQAAVDQFKADLDRVETERHLAVAARLYEACANLYRLNPDSTISNKMCFDVFWERGLPD